MQQTLRVQEDERRSSGGAEGLEALGASRKNCLGWPGLAWVGLERCLQGTQVF